MPYSQLHATCPVCCVTIRQQNLRRHQLRHHPSFAEVRSSAESATRVPVASTVAISGSQLPALTTNEQLSLENLFTVEDSIPTSKITDEAIIRMLSRRNAYTEFELMECLAERYPTIPGFMRQPIVVAATTAARHAAAMQHVFLMNKDSVDPEKRGNKCCKHSILLGPRSGDPRTILSARQFHGSDDYGY